MAQQKLTAKGVKNTTKPGYHGDGGNLYLQVTKWGTRGKARVTKSWIFRYGWHGKTREMGIGGYPLFSLQEARHRAEKWRKVRADGTDPIATRNAERTQAQLEAARQVTFQQCAEKYVANKSADWHSDKHRYHWGATLKNFAYPIIGTLPVAAVDTPAVMRVLDPIWRSKPETASRLRGRIERVLNAAKTQGLRTGDNPARWGGHLSEMLPKTSKVKTKRHHAALPYAEMPAFMAELRQRDGTAARALELLILCGVRTGDIIGQKRDDKPPMRHEHVEGGVWTIPNPKNGRTHRVPLSDRALAILDSLPQSGDFVFVGVDGTPLKEAAMRDLLKTLRSRLTVHGFRSSFRDWAGESTNFPREVCEVAIEHRVGDETERSYQRGDLFEKRRRLMDAWARYCEQKPVANEGDNVVPHRQLQARRDAL